ncbi:hypothetical protein DFH27DRAFT_607496 [Peziza echinospora]|nr:hypothetical protein DFH27DRAFT_607496 [Peziza echinospora]
MGIFKYLATVAVLASTVVGQLESTRYCSPETGICYSSYANDVGITYRVALPTASNSSDALFQIVAPIDYGWAALSWDGHMAYNPLTVAWRDGDNVIVSSRMATYWIPPDPYDGAVYTFLKDTGVNETHWTLSARCQGCTRWEDLDGPVNIEGEAEKVMAYAYSANPVYEPSSNTSSFDVHDHFGHWTHDFAGAKNSSFLTWVNANLAESD